MTTTVKRYRMHATCNGSHDNDSTYWTEVEIDEDSEGEWARYDDIKHLLQNEPPPHRYDIHAIVSPSAVCGLIGCTNRQVHVHDVREPV